MRHKRLFVSFVSWSPFLCILALGTSLLVAQQPNTTRNPLDASADVIAAGRVVFDQTCQSCHAPGGTGDRGPALNTGVFGHGSDDGDLFRTIREGLAGTQMPPFRGLTDEQIWQVVAYLRSLSGVARRRPAANAPTSARQSSVRRDAVLREGRLRQLSPGESTRRDRRARSLHGGARPRRRDSPENSESRGAVRCRSGSRSRRSRRSRRAVGAAARDVAKTSDGREIRGVRRNEDTFSLQMMDASGTLHLLDKLQLADVRIENTSLMPGDYATKLSAGEIDDLVAYLSTLRERDTAIASSAFPAPFPAASPSIDCSTRTPSRRTG